jgi:RNA polymerase subunit RPABC4/transcription elongation factor Spt4
MPYCEKCKKLTEENECSFCGKKAREPKEHDVIYLTTKDFMAARMIEEALADNNIACIMQAVGAGAVGRMITGMARYNLFVSFAAYEKAKERLDQFS